jgi:hypothetical protein
VAGCTCRTKEPPGYRHQAHPGGRPPARWCRAFATLPKPACAGTGEPHAAAPGLHLLCVRGFSRPPGRCSERRAPGWALPRPHRAAGRGASGRYARASSAIDRRLRLLRGALRPVPRPCAARWDGRPPRDHRRGSAHRPRPRPPLPGVSLAPRRGRREPGLEEFFAREVTDYASQWPASGTTLRRLRPRPCSSDRSQRHP